MTGDAPSPRIPWPLGEPLAARGRGTLGPALSALRKAFPDCDEAAVDDVGPVKPPLEMGATRDPAWSSHAATLLRRRDRAVTIQTM